MIKEEATEAMERASKKVDSMVSQGAGTARTTTASALDGAARRLHTSADGLSQFAHKTGDKIDAGARYVREHEPREMMDDMSEMVRAHPGRSMVAALTVGLLLGRAFRS
ncbi:MAG TPA: hypothetical protein VM764_09965 [Gemmatimonadaceae bacterium]|jgi:ElaB/YqjD/DUF883 family membrane-anchored ribosome-binding protein|nr:hypothetical protein [Gemmatimonadaceae bacterium]